MATKKAPKGKTPAKSKAKPAAKRKAAPKKSKAPAKKPPAKNVGGRPSKLTPELLKIAKAYPDNYKAKYKHAIPSVVGLCFILKVTRTTIYDWAKDKATGFSNIVEEINDFQHHELMNGGLKGDHNPTIAKLLLHKHGHSDKVEQENTNVDLTHEEWLNSLEDDD